MTTEKHDDELCENCGHKKGSHNRTGVGKYYRYCMIKNCSCKKFKAKNHSPQIKKSPVKGSLKTFGSKRGNDNKPFEDTPSRGARRGGTHDLVSDEETLGTQTLSDEIENWKNSLFGIVDYHKNHGDGNIIVRGELIKRLDELENLLKNFIKKAKKVDGVQQIQDNLDKSFKGTFKDALLNNYQMDKHYVIVDWEFFHELLEKREIDKLSGKELI